LARSLRKADRWSEEIVGGAEHLGEQQVEVDKHHGSQSALRSCSEWARPLSFILLIDYLS
jgi:hypothetical protein